MLARYDYKTNTHSPGGISVAVLNTNFRPDSDFIDNFDSRLSAVHCWRKLWLQGRRSIGFLGGVAREGSQSVCREHSGSPGRR